MPTTPKEESAKTVASSSSEMDSTKESSSLFVAFGNPLLDIVTNVSQEEEDRLVSKFRLQKDVGQEIETAELLEDIRHKSKTLLPGGCALNTCRALRWLDPSPRSSSVLFVGSAGDDDNRAALESIVRSDGVEPRFSVHPSRPTGHCVALVRGMERTMCANVGAADEFSADDYDSLGMDGVLEKADVVYLTSFFAKHSWDVVERISSLCSRRPSVRLAFNLNGEYVFQDPGFVMQVVALLPRVDVLFGNRNEFRAFVSSSRRLGYKSAILNGIMKVIDRMDGPQVIQEELEVELNHGDQQEESLLSRTTVVVTDGPSPVLCFDVVVRPAPLPPSAPSTSSSPKPDPIASAVSRIAALRSVDPPAVAPADIVDTIGAGDSFVAGYAQAMMAATRSKVRGGRRKKEDPGDRVKCVQRGIYTSQQMIRQMGTELPRQPPRPMMP